MTPEVAFAIAEGIVVAAAFVLLAIGLWVTGGDD